jgi:hypothetical protein
MLPRAMDSLGLSVSSSMAYGTLSLTVGLLYLLHLLHCLPAGRTRLRAQAILATVVFAHASLATARYWPAPDAEPRLARAVPPGWSLRSARSTDQAMEELDRVAVRAEQDRHLLMVRRLP